MGELFLLGLGMLLLVLTWDYMAKPTYLDEARDQLFDIRDKELKDFFLKQELGLRDPAYKKLREHINGLLRYTEKVTLLGFVLNLAAEAKHSNRTTPKIESQPKSMQTKNDDTAIKKFEAKIKNESAAVMWHYMISSSVLGRFLTVLTFLMLNGQALITSIKKLSYPAWVNTFSSITAVTTLIAAFTPAVNADEFTENFQEVLEAQATKEI